MRSQDGLHCETNSLSLRSGERVRERGAWEIRDRFQAMFSRLSPLPGPLPARSSRGEGEDEAPPAPRAFVAYPTDSSVCSPMFAYVRLMGEKCSRRRMVNAVRSCKMHDKRSWGLVELAPPSTRGNVWRGRASIWVERVGC